MEKLSFWKENYSSESNCFGIKSTNLALENTNFNLKISLRTRKLFYIKILTKNIVFALKL